jgi:hypothetical protein
VTASIVFVAALVVSPETGVPQPSSSMQEDVDRLARAAEKLTGAWPSQAPPPIPEVALVARHGRPVAALLVALLSDDPHIERDRKRWKVQQQVSLALARIYSEGEHCGRIYCDGDPPERIGSVKRGWLRKIASDAELRALPSRELLVRFREEKVFWQQLEIAKALVAANDAGMAEELAEWLTHEDRHLRGNVAFVLGRLGDPRGFDTVAGMLDDWSERSPGQGIPGGRWSLDAQIRADRYYAVHLLGDLKDPGGVQLLVPLLQGEHLGEIAAWSLGEIGDARAVGALLQVLERDDPSMRVVAIAALTKLNARAALPKLRQLLRDHRRSNFGGLTTVAEAARRAIAVLAARR